MTRSTHVVLVLIPDAPPEWLILFLLPPPSLPWDQEF
jgi:hypothetical protein